MNDNKSQKIAIMYRSSYGTGLFSNFIKFCGGFKYCEENGLVPVIDMKNHANMYQQSKSENSWEHFFEQPCGYSLDEIDQMAIA